MFEAQFIDLQSPVHRLDPRFRVLAAAAFSLAVALLQRPVPALVGLGVGIGLALAASLPPGALAKRLLAVNFFTLFLWLFLPFSLSGDPVLVLGPLTATQQGIALATLITIKTNAIVLGFIALVSTLPIPEIGQALRRLHVPAKLTYLLVFTYRYVFVIAGEYRRMRQAMKIRGFRPRTNLHTYRSYAYLVGMVLVRGLDRSERVYCAMLCRGFKGEFHSLNGLHASLADALFLTFILAVSACLPLLEPLGYLP